MCVCTPSIRTPYCGRFGCGNPKQEIKVERLKLEDINTDTEEGKLLATSIGMLMNYHRTKTPDEILKMLY